MPSSRNGRNSAERAPTTARTVPSSTPRPTFARCAGVMFTRSPTTGDKSVITIEGAPGLGSAVVSGEVTPDRWVLGKLTGEISVRDISDKHAKQVPAEGIEWAIDKAGQLLLLQSRPETVWATRDALAPVKPPEDNPLKHVMSIFGGKR